MSLYNLMFGQSEYSTSILATLGLTKESVGRFRDCFVADGEIAVYTRNGGGNRMCWHLDTPQYGEKGCKHTVRKEDVMETINVPKGEADNYPKKYNVFYGSKQMVETGKVITVKRYTCLAPASIDCACPGCVITYRLPMHPNYLRDKDDSFDCTYATIYFGFPNEWREELEKIDTGEEFDPDSRWQVLIESLGG